MDESRWIGTLFHPHQTERRAVTGAQDFDIPVEEGVHIGARWHRQDASWRTVLFFHGNGETVNDYDDIAPAFQAIGLNLFVVDYRGYGWSQGMPSIGTLHPDAKRALSFLKERSKGAPLPLVMGRSLGSCPAAFLADQHGDDLSGLILESGFADIRPLAERLGLRLDREAARLLHESHSNHLKLARVRLPVLLIHGGRDVLIPPQHARDNLAAVGHDRKELALIAGAGHNDLLAFSREYFGAIARFRDRLKAGAPR